MELKQRYTEKEVTEIVSWFEQQKEQLPQSLRIDKTLNIPDLKRTVNDLCILAKKRYDSPTFSAQIGFLFTIREIIEGRRA